MVSSSFSANGFAGGWPADDLGIILIRFADRFCRIRYGGSTIEQFRETSNCSDSQMRKDPLSSTPAVAEADTRQA